jgi:uncharacterized metal-binding protein
MRDVMEKRKGHLRKRGLVTGEINCIACKAYRCRYPETKKSPPSSCPRRIYPTLVKQTIEKSRDDPSIHKITFACEEAIYRGCDSVGSHWPRVRELIEYARILGYRKLGIAACAGLIEESKILGEILTDAGFKVILVNCMAGGTTRKKLALKERGGVASFIVCSPLFQAEVLNRANTELNVMMGLCLGHDTLFIKNSKADVTPLVVKDRLTGHNPVAALYTSKTSYRYKLWNLGNQASPVPQGRREGT